MDGAKPIERRGTRPGAAEDSVAGPGSVAAQVAALESEVERLRQAEKALLQSNDAMRLLSETANELLAQENPQEAINTLFEKLSARLGLEVYFNYLVDEEKGKLHLNSYAGIPPDVARDIEWLEYGQAVCGCVARDSCRIVAEDIQHSEDLRADLVRSFGISAYACHPLIAHGKVIGTFSFGTSRKPFFDPHELALMQAICDQMSMAMERTLLIAELRQQYCATREALKMRDEFLSVAAHELKTPVTSLRGFAQAVIRQLESGKAVDEARLRRTLQVLDQQSGKLAYLVNQLLDVSRIEAGQLALDRRSVELGELAREVVEAVQMTAPHHDLSLRVHEVIWALADPLRLEQVLRNLLDNAVRFSPKGSRVDVDVWSPDIGTAKVAVRDRGVGIPPEQREHIFDRFCQAHAAEHTSGIGMGLYISRQIVELHGGKIEMEQHAEGGTRVVFSLPTAVVDVKSELYHERGEILR
jgi:K+-sensing histidine kinase KdpD